MPGTTPENREGFTGELWCSITNIYAEIMKHPFLQGLTDGSLPEECFEYYVLQDSLYLADYARALALAGVRSPDESAFAMFCEHATGAIQVEQSLHESLLKDFGISTEEVEPMLPAPTTLAYTSYLLRAASLRDYPDAVGAVLPCYWIYAEAGAALVEQGSPNSRYQRWIDTYSGEEFGEIVASVLDLTDRVCEDLNPSQRAAVTEHFITTSRYEWMFWDAAWNLEDWPV